jgi:uncharacterized membrane-anchored protein YjiN (DUF445 family)
LRDLEIEEIEKLRQLNRVKVMATLVLIACFLVMVIAKVLEHNIPAFGAVAAFAEAATIGGIADWYAVVALFKRPLNLPFPHTAIISNNQHRIADNLGRFIERNFLAREPVEEKLREIDFAGEISNWLAAPSRSESLARFAVRLVPQLIQNIDDKGVVAFATQRVTGQIAKTDIAPLVGQVLQSFTTHGRHQKLLDDLIRALHRFLNDETTLEIVRSRVQKELPVLFNILGADSVVLRRIVSAATELLTEIKEDADHPLRAEFETFLISYIERTRRTKGFARQVENAKQVLLARPELDDAAQHLWDGLKDYILRDSRAEDSVLVARMTEMFVEVGTSLADEPNLRRDINDGMVIVLSNLVEEQRGSIAAYVAEQVKGWDMQRLLVLIEVNVGRDLQYIRFNGMIIGGCVGLTLYAIETLLLS